MSLRAAFLFFAAKQSSSNQEIASGEVHHPRNDIYLIKIIYVLFLFSLTACNAPIQATPISATPTFIIPTSTQTFIPAQVTVTSEATVTLTPTSTPIPCDPLNTDYCISNWNFLFQRPFLPPNNNSIDMSYPYASTQRGRREGHHGVEIQNPFGTSVYAAGDGTVVFAATDEVIKFSPWNNFYGNMVLIKHANGFYTLYAHLSAILVEEGTQVQAGDLIGEVGQTGGATGSHLHVEIRQGGDGTDYLSTQNPELWFIPNDGTGALSITLNTPYDSNYEYPLVITRLADGFVVYISSYAESFEYNPEDAVLNNLPEGQYKIAFNDRSGLNERVVTIEAGKLTEVVFEVK